MENALTLSYDCQKNLIMPKIPDQAAYYARQLYLYNCTIFQGSSVSSQNTHNTFSYVWTENEYAKASSQIASALHHRLCNSEIADAVSMIRLFCDGCGGQNKNKGTLGMLLHWLLFEAPKNIKKIEVWFPIVGHSFLPPDRIFGKLEREFKSRSVIEGPEEYIEIIKKYATLTRLGEGCPVMNWKSYSDDILKQPGQWHFKMQKSKKITITRSQTCRNVLVQGDPFYNIDTGEPKSLCKRGKNYKQNGQITSIEKGVEVKPAKLRDIKRLLCLHFGDNWTENKKLEFYKQFFSGEGGGDDGVIDDGDSDVNSDFELLEQDDVDFT